MLGGLRWLDGDVFICSEQSDPERLPLGEKTLTSLLKSSSLCLPCSLWKKRMFILHLSSFQAPQVSMSRGTSLLMDVWKHLSQNWKLWSALSMSTDPDVHSEEIMSMLHPCVLSIPWWQGPPPKVYSLFLPEKNLKLSCGHLTSCRWWSAVTASIAEWWQYEWSRYLQCTVMTQAAVILSNFLERVTTNIESCLRGSL